MRSVDPGGSRRSRAFEVAFVCTANRARSPFAAALLRRHVAGLPVAVESFGTSEVGGAPVLTAAARTARAFGVDIGEHRSRPLQRGELAGYDLAIGFELLHVASAVTLGEASKSNSFLLAELAAGLDAVGPGASGRGVEPEARVALADAQRRAGEVSRQIADPAGGSDQQFLAIFGEIDRLVAIIALQLFGTGEQAS